LGIRVDHFQQFARIPTSVAEAPATDRDKTVRCRPVIVLDVPGAVGLWE